MHLFVVGFGQLGLCLSYDHVGSNAHEILKLLISYASKASLALKELLLFELMKNISR